jgi:predicted GIY-YIG superfamily endonuclease
MPAKSITVFGVIYPSIDAAARAHDLKPITVDKRLKKGWPIERAFSRVSQRDRPVEIGGRVYASLKAAATAAGISTQTLLVRLNNGWTKEQAIGLSDPPATWHRNRAGRSVSVKGKSYSTVAKAARAYGIEPTLALQRLNEGGWTIEQALEIDTSRIREKGAGSLYVITNIANGKQYIGITLRSLASRLEHHFQYAQKRHGREESLQAAIRKHGREAFRIELLRAANSIKEMRQLERHYISKLGTRQPHGYNVRPGGEIGNPITTKVTVDGRTFRSAATMCRHYQITEQKYHGRRHRGWTVRQALSLDAPPTHSNASTVLIDGEMFESYKKAAAHFQVNAQTFRNRIDRGWTAEQAAGLGDPPHYQAAGSKSVAFRGKRYPSITALAAGYGVNHQTFRTRRRRGLSISQALGLSD